MRQRRRQGRRRPSIDGDRKRGSTAPACYRRTLGDDQGVLRPVSPLWRAGVRRGVGTGMAARSVVPSPGVETMRRVPPRASRRSSMLVRPLLRVRPVGQQQISGRTILRHASVRQSPLSREASSGCRCGPTLGTLLLYDLSSDGSGPDRRARLSRSQQGQLG